MDEALERAGNFLAREDGDRRGALEVDNQVVVAREPASVAAEQYRVLHQRLERLRAVQPLKTLAFTSALAGEGKSMTAVNLALVAAAVGLDRKVLIIDADLRRPRVHLLLGVDGRPGLGEVLAGEAEVSEALQRVPNTRLAVLPAGAPREDATHLATGLRMKRLLAEAAATFDEVYVDAPPVLAVADGAYLASICDGTVLVVRAGITPRSILLQAQEALSGLPVVGCVLNGVERADAPHLWGPKNSVR